MAYEFYLQVVGKDQKTFKGDKKPKKGREDWMLCTAIEMGVHNPYDPNTGEVKTNTVREPLHLTKEWSPASPMIAQAAYRQETLDKVVIEVVGRSEDGKNEIVIERITLDEAKVIKFKRFTETPTKEASLHDTEHLETVGFGYRKVTFERPMDSTTTMYDWANPDA
jgi:type VI secretion system Hcp family effector